MRLLLPLTALVVFAIPVHAAPWTSPEQQALATSATEQPQPSPALVQALELDVAP